MAKPFQAVLLGVLGTTPAILTEAFYYFACIRSSRVVFGEVHVLTTAKGREMALDELLGSERRAPGAFDRLLKQLRIPRRRVSFGENTIHLLRGRDGRPLDDVRDSADSFAIADQICEKTAALCARKETAVYATIAGGRKTMGVYLATALQLYARPQDCLFHVLVDPRLEIARAPGFYFPERALRLEGKLVKPEEQRIECVEIPILYFPWGAKEPRSFRALHAARQRELNWLSNPPPLRLDGRAGAARIGEERLELDPLEFYYYYFFAELRRNGPAPAFSPREFGEFWRQGQARGGAGSGSGAGGVQPLERHLKRLKRLFEVLLPGQGGRAADFTARMNRDFAPTGDYTVALSSTLAKIRRKVERVVPAPLASRYAITKSREYGRAEYALGLDATRIEFVNPVA